MKRRILFLYLTKHSGHYAAARAIQQAILRLEPDTQTRMLDSFKHSNPVLSKVTLHAYLAILKAAPEIWEYMYDNPEFKARTARIREILNRGNSQKLNEVIRRFRPDTVVCTQAFACGVMASWKRANRDNDLKLVGVLTDFVAHRYWADPDVDLYVAPNDEIRVALESQGVAPSHIVVTGIPISPRFSEPIDRNAVAQRFDLKPDHPLILVMGGSLGLVPMKSIIRQLDRLPQPFHIIAVTGQNARLQRALARRRRRLRHPTKILGFVDCIPELMELAEMVISKPGGITTAEALVKRLPMIIIQPIPGQEQKNADFLLRHGVAVQANNPEEAAHYVSDFLRNPEKLRAMREAAAAVARPNAAEDAARAILALRSVPQLVAA
ncbi:MAG: glycosyltransferase [Verrucomicrobiae bacterium]|nr:glycosyltransferase [Verrucomicrobiae bacterium]MDW8344116.1 glycosyltransferase [Verrucomicrobiae bacterium]